MKRRRTMIEIERLIGTAIFLYIIYYQFKSIYGIYNNKVKENEKVRVRGGNKFKGGAGPWGK